MTFVLDHIGLAVGGVSGHRRRLPDARARRLNVLLGPTLAGKTTFMRLMAGLDRPTKGRLLLDGAT